MTGEGRTCVTCTEPAIGDVNGIPFCGNPAHVEYAVGAMFEPFIDALEAAGLGRSRIGARELAAQVAPRWERQLPDGRYVDVWYLHAGVVRLQVKRTPEQRYYEDTWDYPTTGEAIAAAEAWDGTGEPAGWYRHPSTGRRRPAGDPAREYVNP